MAVDGQSPGTISILEAFGGVGEGDRTTQPRWKSTLLPAAGSRGLDRACLRLESWSTQHSPLCSGNTGEGAGTLVRILSTKLDMNPKQMVFCSESVMGSWEVRATAVNAESGSKIRGGGRQGGRCTSNRSTIGARGLGRLDSSPTLHGASSDICLLSSIWSKSHNHLSDPGASGAKSARNHEQSIYPPPPAALFASKINFFDFLGVKVLKLKVDLNPVLQVWPPWSGHLAGKMLAKTEVTPQPQTPNLSASNLLSLLFVVVLNSGHTRFTHRLFRKARTRRP